MFQSGAEPDRTGSLPEGDPRTHSRPTDPQREGWRRRWAAAALGLALLAGAVSAYAVWGTRAPALPLTPAVTVSRRCRRLRPSRVEESGRTPEEPRGQPPRRVRRAKAQSAVLPQHAPPVPSVAVGYLTADARPWAELFVDGKRVERTPLSRYPLPLGSHVLQFKNPELQREARRAITIVEGKTETVRVDFER